MILWIMKSLKSRRVDRQMGNLKSYQEQQDFSKTNKTINQTTNSQPARQWTLWL